MRVGFDIVEGKKQQKNMFSEFVWNLMLKISLHFILTIQYFYAAKMLYIYVIYKI